MPGGNGKIVNAISAYIRSLNSKNSFFQNKSDDELIRSLVDLEYLREIGSFKHFVLTFNYNFFWDAFWFAQRYIKEISELYDLPLHACCGEFSGLVTRYCGTGTVPEGSSVWF